MEAALCEACVRQDRNMARALFSERQVRILHAIVHPETCLLPAAESDHDSL